MFDTLYINKALLPLTEEQKAILPDSQSWQTKDLDCLLTTVSITDEGELEIDRTPDGWLYPTTDNEDSIVVSKKSERKIEVIPYHGYIRFYSSVDKEWFEFKAKFTDGKLVAIERT